MIPREFQEYELNSSTGQMEQFLRHDSGPGPDRLLIFTTQNNLRLLETSDHWFADGTFSISPPLFTQLYTIHAEYLNQVHPALYALLPSKSSTTYDRLLREVQNLTPAANPKSILTDFELAAINSFRRNFAGAEIKGCFFHLFQSVWRRIQSLGLQQEYSQNSNFALSARMIFVPVQQMDDYFIDLSNYLDPSLQPILDYFEDNYLGRIQRRGTTRRTPMFEPQVWNVFLRTLLREPTTPLKHGTEECQPHLQCNIQLFGNL